MSSLSENLLTVGKHPGIVTATSLGAAPPPGSAMWMLSAPARKLASLMWSNQGKKKSVPAAEAGSAGSSLKDELSYFTR